MSNVDTISCVSGHLFILAYLDPIYSKMTRDANYLRIQLEYSTWVEMGVHVTTTSSVVLCEAFPNNCPDILYDLPANGDGLSSSLDSLYSWSLIFSAS